MRAVSCVMLKHLLLLFHRSSTMWVMPRTSKQLFLRNHSLQRQKWLMLLDYRSPDPRENKQIVSEYTRVLCKYILKLCVTVQDVHQHWPLWKNSFDSAAVICQGHGSYLQLSLAYVTSNAMLHFFSLTCMKAQNVPRGLCDLFLKDHHWVLFGWLNYDRLGALSQSDC